MKSEESGQGSFIDRETTSDSFYKICADVRDCREQVGNYGCASERYLAPWEHIAYESCCYDSK